MDHRYRLDLCRVTRTRIREEAACARPAVVATWVMSVSPLQMTRIAEGVISQVGSLNSQAPSPRSTRLDPRCFSLVGMHLVIGLTGL